MIERKQKKCKGTGKANGFGCGEILYLFRYGMCKKCYKEFLFSNDGIHLLKKAQIRGKKRAVKEKKKEDRQKNEAIKNKSYYEKKLQTIINSIVRLIDNDKGCISCSHGWDKPATRQMHAGHRLSVGSNPQLRFNVIQIFKQCSICNNYKSGNEREYDKGIIEHYSQNKLDNILKLKEQHQSIKLTINELKTAIIKANEIKKRILNGEDFTREFINNFIGIYKNG